MRNKELVLQRNEGHKPSLRPSLKQEEGQTKRSEQSRGHEEGRPDCPRLAASVAWTGAVERHDHVILLRYSERNNYQKEKRRKLAWQLRKKAEHEIGAQADEHQEEKKTDMSHEDGERGSESASGGEEAGRFTTFLSFTRDRERKAAKGKEHKTKGKLKRMEAMQSNSAT